MIFKKWKIVISLKEIRNIDKEIAHFNLQSALGASDNLVALFDKKFANSCFAFTFKSIENTHQKHQKYFRLAKFQIFSRAANEIFGETN